MSKFSIRPENLELGVVHTHLAVIRGLHIPEGDPPELASRRQAVLEKVLSYTDLDLSASAPLRGFHQLYQRLGYDSSEVKPAAEDFVRLVQKREAIPKINAAVDSYNLVVLESLMGIGAHDLARIEGDVVFRLANGRERFTPLGRSRTKPVPAGDFLYRDDTKVLARLASDDCDEAKLTASTTSVLLVSEAHDQVTVEFVRTQVQRACEQIVEFCGGSFQIMQPSIAPEA